MKTSKKLLAIAEKHDKTFPHPLDDAIKLVKKYKFVKFDESVDLAITESLAMRC